MYQRINSRPDNTDSPEVKSVKERTVSAAFMHYLASTGPFAGWQEEQAEFKTLMVCLYSIISHIHCC